jgi:hypothetical protein
MTCSNETEDILYVITGDLIAGFSKCISELKPKSLIPCFGTVSTISATSSGTAFTGGYTAPFNHHNARKRSPIKIGI